MEFGFLILVGVMETRILLYMYLMYIITIYFYKLSLICSALLLRVYHILLMAENFYIKKDVTTDDCYYIELSKRAIPAHTGPFSHGLGFGQPNLCRTG